ncbi:MAG: hypothetical protein KAU22_01495 [Desulfuromonadales bacterium]|nr:hypothetical protein [Desulfuromonadales bacterium]
MIFLPRGNPVRKKVDPARINLPEAMEKLRGSAFTGYLRFDASSGSGIILFREGKLISSIYLEEGDAQRLIAYDAIAKIFAISISGDAVLNIYRQSADLVLSMHALLHGNYLLKDVDLTRLDVSLPLERIRNEGLTVCLRISALNQTTLIFYDQGYALGFVHEGSVELEQTADVATSVACLPGAKFDMLEIQSADDLVLADLMGSADLGPIWQRTRNDVLQDRHQREEREVRSQEQNQSNRRQHIFGNFKAIAGNHIGKFGVNQVEKAFASVGSELSSKEMQSYYIELQRLARLVAEPSKIESMIAEMKKKFDS